ncbi:Cytochrome P450 3A4 [Araneus ventricosus]|uniref:Cytochrome P450 3A4 n=1 Tax=Araneus ventricosus TaxID=182803 RepID=A0A4Y2QA88_ARAVE|nr:Cytochrome P450 3A4 [Araneus ventricosus]
MVGDPVLLRDIMVKDFHIFPNRRPLSSGDPIMDWNVSSVTGEDWKRIRTIITPTFSTGKIKRMMGIFKECSETVIQNFKKTTENGEPVELKRIFGAFTMDVIASSAFSTKLDSHNDPENEFVQMATMIFRPKVNWRVLLYFLFPNFVKFMGISIFPPNGTNFFRDVTLNIIAQRRKTELTVNELVAQCIIFFLAGYDTTASTLSFVIYNLALHEDIQEKVHNELVGALEGTHGELTYEALQSMKYLDNVISETLRLYPPAVRTEREAASEYKLGETGITIPKGMILTIPIYAMHRDPKFFRNPGTFDPDRFNQDEKSKREQYAFMPFGAGPRNCVAMRFALMEIKVCLAHILANYKISKCPKTKVPMEFLKGQGTLQPKEIFVSLESRKDNPIVK